MTTAANEVSKRMTTIMRLFIQGQSISENEKNLAILQQQLDETENEYRSVAFEAASMAIAIDDFENGTGLRQWNEFNNRIGKTHASQVHAGLGWAIAQKNISPTGILENLNVLMQFRVVDGCGYYDGIFRQQSSMKNKIIPPAYLKYLTGYDQGIGRSIYYYYRGAIENVAALIAEFPESRQADLWRGVGIACIYVGGFDEIMLETIFKMAGKHQSQLPVSAALVSRARHDAGSVTPYVESACILWCHKTFPEVVAITLKTESEFHDFDEAYKQWMNAISEELYPLITGGVK